MDPPPAAPRNTKKLPRTSSSGDIVGGPARKKKKKDKTGKGGGGTPKLDAMPNVEPSPMDHPTAHRNSMQKDTATADGHMMAQLLATFSPQELRRFQSFQRASFSSSIIEPFVAACIQHRTGNTTQRRWSLDDCVAPGHAAEIGLLVAVAAKIYAQRLVAAAVRLQSKAATTSAPASERRVLLATSVYRAVQERRGNPAGLFIPSESEEFQHLPCVTFAASQSRRDAALAAQEAYDALHGVSDTTEERGEQAPTDPVDAMDVEEPAPLAVEES